MTMKERRNPDIINGSRRARIARGSGTTVQQVNQLLKQFDQMRRMMQSVMRPGRRMPQLPGGMGRFGGMGGGLPGMGVPGGLPGMGAGIPGLGGGFPSLPGSGKSAAKKKRDKNRRKNKKR